MKGIFRAFKLGTLPAAMAAGAQPSPPVPRMRFTRVPSFAPVIEE